MSNHPNRSKLYGVKLSHADYRLACAQAFQANMSDPSVFWNKIDGFYVAPSRRLAPNHDYCVGLAYYDLNNDSARSLSGSRREYQPIARGIREFYRFGGVLRDHIESAQNDADYNRYQTEI